MPFVHGSEAGAPKRFRWLILLAAMILGLTLGACDSLLEVELPGEVTEDALRDARLAETLVLSTQAEFEAGLGGFVLVPGLWYEEFENSNSSRTDNLWGTRSAQTEEFSIGTWAGLHSPRLAAKLAVEIIQDLGGAVTDSDFLVAKARLYEGYAIQLLGEAFCQVTLDGGPALTRAQAWAEAEQKFTEAINLASEVTTGPRVSEAADVLSAAYVGRARARLSIGGNDAGVLSDASAVPAGFQYTAFYEDNPTNRRNDIYDTNNNGRTSIPHRRYSDLTIAADGRLTVNDGVADPRVPVVPMPGEETRGGVLELRVQMKYPGRDADIPFSSWREAQLMMAEVQGGAAAVTIINNLRASVADLAHVPSSHPSLPLPQFSSSDPAEIQATIQEERKRELWMQGTRPGDMLRFNIPFSTANEAGIPMSPGGCLVIPLDERLANPNLGA